MSCLPIYQFNDLRIIGEKIDHVEATVVLLKDKDLRKVQLEEMTEDNPVYAFMGYNENVSFVIAGKNRVEARINPFGKTDKVFTFGNLEVQDVGLPFCCFFRELFREFCETQAFPGAEVKFPQLGKLKNLGIMVSGYNLSPEGGTLKVTGINHPYVCVTESLGKTLHLHSSDGCKGSIGEAAHNLFFESVDLTVSGQVKSHVSFHDAES